MDFRSAKRGDQRNRALSRLPFFRGLSKKNDDNIDKYKTKRVNQSNGVNKETLDEAFNTLLNELREYVVGQEEYTKKLCIST